MSKMSCKHSFGSYPHFSPKCSNLVENNIMRGIVFAAVECIFEILSEKT
jgi:hypothetical protein